MKKQKAMSQIKGQDKTREKQLSEMELGNLPEKEFRINPGYLEDISFWLNLHKSQAIGQPDII